MPPQSPGILIVEDEAVIATQIEFTLRGLGYRVVGKVGNGDAALDVLASARPDLVLLDIHIKGTRNGIDLARIIREKYAYPFVFLTAFSDRQTVGQLKDTMPYGYIVKPFNAGELLTTIELALHKYADEQEGDYPTLERINRKLSVGLTRREHAVLGLLWEGLSYREVGERLYVSINTVKYYQKAIFTKLGASSRLEALRWLQSL